MAYENGRRVNKYARKMIGKKKQIQLHFNRRMYKGSYFSSQLSYEKALASSPCFSVEWGEEYWRNPRAKVASRRYLKKRASKAARYYNEELSNGAHYRKTFDYWYMLY